MITCLCIQAIAGVAFAAREMIVGEDLWWLRFTVCGIGGGFVGLVGVTLFRETQEA